MTGAVLRLDLEGRRQRRELGLLLAEARQAIVAAEAGDLESTYLAHWALSRAVNVLLKYRLDVA